MYTQESSNGVVFFIFGATGDLAKRKLYPAIYSMYREGNLAKNFAVVGLARRPRTNEDFRQDVHNSIQEFSRHRNLDEVEFTEFAQHFSYMSLDINHVD